MAYKKERLKKLEKSMIPPGAFMVVWEDPDKEGVYYDSPYYCDPTKRKAYTEQDIKPLRDDPNGILFVVSYADKLKDPKNP